jgi:hypothetical protein
MIRKIACWITLIAFPVSLMAADTGAAMLHAKGAWLNGTPAPASATVFPGDLVQTDSKSVANINATGSGVTVLADSLVKFEGDKLGLDHGGVSVMTSKKFTARAGEVTVVPVSDKWTEFQMNESGGKVQIIARQGELSVTDASGTTTVASGQQITRYARYADNKKGEGAAPAAGGGLLDSPVFVGIGGAAIGALVTWAIMQDSKPFSPAAP